MSGRNQHVVKHGDDWAYRGASNSRVTAVFSTQQEAIDAGRQTAINQGTELLIHGRNGQIRARESYGNDPANIRDTEY